MKKFVCYILSFVMIMICSSCTNTAMDKSSSLEPQVSQMKAICELAVMDCYYHNVAKFTEEDAQGMLWWKKDKHFWIEYSGIVKLGIDASQLKVENNNSEITITLPEAKVLSCKVDSSSLTEDSFIVDRESANIEALDEIKAFDVAQSKLEETAANDQLLLTNAQQRVQELINSYITNIESVVGKNYTIHWVYADADENTKDASKAVEEPELTNEDSSDL